jgi:hypothetical protein
MSGNLCPLRRLPGIVAAIQEVHSGRQASQTWRFADERQLADARREGPRCDRLATCARTDPDAAAQAVAANPQGEFLAAGRTSST